MAKMRGGLVRHGVDEKLVKKVLALREKRIRERQKPVHRGLSCAIGRVSRHGQGCQCLARSHDARAAAEEQKNSRCGTREHAASLSLPGTVFTRAITPRFIRLDTETSGPISTSPPYSTGKVEVQSGAVIWLPWNSDVPDKKNGNVGGSLSAWGAGGGGGTAVADMAVGSVYYANASGKLKVTVEAAIGGLYRVAIPADWLGSAQGLMELYAEVVTLDAYDYASLPIKGTPTIVASPFIVGPVAPLGKNADSDNIGGGYSEPKNYSASVTDDYIEAGTYNLLLGGTTQFIFAFPGTDAAMDAYTTIKSITYDFSSS